MGAGSSRPGDTRGAGGGTGVPGSTEGVGTVHLARRTALLLGGSLAVTAASGCVGLRELGTQVLGHPEARRLRRSECLLPGDIDLEAEEDRLRARKRELDDMYGVVYEIRPWEPDPELRFTDRALAVSPDGTRVMAHEARDRAYLDLVEDYGTITWDTTTGEVLSRVQLSPGEIRWHPTQERLAVIGEVAVDLTDPAGQPTTHLVGHWIGADWHSSLIGDMRISPDGTRIVTCGLDRTLRLWSTEEGTCNPVETRKLRGIEPRELSYSPDGAHLVVTGRDGPIHRYDAATGRRTDVLVDDVEYVYAPVIEPDGTMLVGIGSGTLLVIAPDDSRTHVELPDGYEPGSIAVSAQGQIAMLSNPGDMVALWDRHTGIVQDLPGGPARTERLAWAPDGSVLYALSLTEGVRAWDGESWRSFDLPS